MVAAHRGCGVPRYPFVLTDWWVLDQDRAGVDVLRVGLVDVERVTGPVVVDGRYAVGDRPVGGRVPHHHPQLVRSGLAAGVLSGRAAVVAVQHEPHVLARDAFGRTLDRDLPVRGHHQPLDVLVTAQVEVQARRQGEGDRAVGYRRRPQRVARREVEATVTGCVEPAVAPGNTRSWVVHHHHDTGRVGH